MLPFIALLYFVASADAIVQLQTSAIYDELDLNGVNEISLASCIIGGCSVYVSVPQWNVEATKNLYVNIKGQKTSMYSFATEYDQATLAKTGFHTAETVVSIKNENTKDVGPIVIYVVGSQAPMYNSNQVEIYDASNINQRPSKNKQLTMIMSAEGYNIYVSALGTNLNAYVRAAGFDNNWQRTSQDGCQIIYDHNDGKPFRLRINSPIITINFDGQFNYQICANIDQYNGALLNYPGVATSQGYVGCSANQYAAYRSSQYTSSVFELKDSSNTERSTDLQWNGFMKMSDKVAVTTYFNQGTSSFNIGGDDGNGKIESDKRTVKAYKINAVFTSQYGSSYWMGYAPGTNAPYTIPSGEGICTDSSKSSTASQTAATMTPTTSGSNEFFTVLTSSIVFFVARNL